MSGLTGHTVANADQSLGTPAAGRRKVDVQSLTHLVGTKSDPERSGGRRCWGEGWMCSPFSPVNVDSLRSGKGPEGNYMVFGHVESSLVTWVETHPGEFL